MYIKVNYDRYEYLGRAPDENDDWDGGDTAADITINGLKIVKDGEYHDLAVPFDVKKGKTYYLVWADYDTGDSFGRDGNHAEFLDLFETKEKAEACAAAAKATKEYHFAYERENGQRIQFSAAWFGYFESLNEINITEVSL